VDAHRVGVDLMDHVIYPVHMGDPEVHLADTVRSDHEAETALDLSKIHFFVVQRTVRQPKNSLCNRICNAATHQ
jgi:hypothetical protein